MSTQSFQNILQMFSFQTGSQNSRGQIKKIKYKASQFFTSIIQYQEYPQQIKKLFHAIFYDPELNPSQKQTLIKIDGILNFPKIKTKMPICNKRLIQRQTAFRCYDCMTHEASIICQSCFENGNHKGHRYNQMPSGGGNCDCGNPDAIKVQGFCKHHPGKADPVLIDQKQFNYFFYHFMLLFKWLFKLYQKTQNKSADQLGQIISAYLIKINEQSLYYNTMTYKLLYCKISQKQQQFLIQKIFQCGIKCINFARRMTTLYFSMFSLQIFKYQLTISYCKAYNKYNDFQKSRFKQLYIQLYANNDLVYNLVTKQKLVLLPYNKQYDYTQYVQNLMFLSTIKPYVAKQYFSHLMSQTIIQLPLLDYLQKHVQIGSLHIVDYLNQNLNTQNSYYTLHESIINFFKKNQQMLSIMLLKYTDAVLDQKYSYKKNKVVEPFHKILAMIILTIFNGNIQKIQINKLKELGLSQMRLQKVCNKVFKLLLICYGQISLTYLRDTYLDSYVHLYIKSGNTIVVYDQIMFKICMKIFKQMNNLNQINQVIHQVFQINSNKQQKPIKIKQNKMEIQQNQRMQLQKYSNFAQNGSEMLQQSQQWQDVGEQYYKVQRHQQEQKQKDLTKILQKRIQLISKNLYLIKLIIQNCITKRAQVKLCSIFNLSNSEILQNNELITAELLNNFKYLTGQQIKLILRNFFDSKHTQQQKFIKNYFTFDKNKKKYQVDTQVTQKISKNKLPLSLLLTLKKIGNIFTEDVLKEQQAVTQFTCSSQAYQLLNLFFNPQFLKNIINFFTEELINNKDNTTINNLFLNFYQTMNILKELMRKQKNQIIQQFLNDVPKLILNKQLKYLTDKMNQKTQAILGKQKKQLLMKKFNQKKSKRLMQMTKSQQVYAVKQKIQQQQILQQCLVCRQDNSSGLCLFANINYSNILQIMNNAQGRSLSFGCCFHPIHDSCFIKSSKNHTSLPCPLCNRQSNIILPSEKQIENIQLIKEIYERIITIRVLVAGQYKGFQKQLEENGILNILKAITATIGRSLLQNQPILNEKAQKLLNNIYNFTTTVFRKILKKTQIQQQIKAIQKFLELIKNLAFKNTSNKSNYYACQYLTIKIFYLCLTHQSNKCSDILCESIVSLINREDVRKIWQMCNQLVNLPEFKIRQPIYSIYSEIDQMHKRVNYYCPPRFINELIQLRDCKQYSCKTGHQMCICIICKTQHCLDCKKLKEHFQLSHCNQGLSFNLMTGGFIFMLQSKAIHIPSLYINSVGSEWKPSKLGKDYQFDYNVYKQITDQILKESLLKYLMTKYPDLLKRTTLMENLF